MKAYLTRKLEQSHSMIEACAADFSGAVPALVSSRDEVMRYREVQVAMQNLDKLSQMSASQMRINPWLVKALITHGEACVSGEMEILGIVAALLCSFVVGPVIDPPADIPDLGANAFLISFYGTLCATATSAMCLIHFAAEPAEERVAVMEARGGPSLQVSIPVVTEPAAIRTRLQPMTSTSPLARTTVCTDAAGVWRLPLDPVAVDADGGHCATSCNYGCRDKPVPRALPKRCHHNLYRHAPVLHPDAILH